MIINERGLERAIRTAWRRGGYTVAVFEDCMAIWTQNWYVQNRRRGIPRKALAAIVEHIGGLPEGAPLLVKHDEEPQEVLGEVVDAEMALWRGERATELVTITTVQAFGLRLYQEDGGLTCYGVDQRSLGIVESEVAAHETGTVMDENKLLWQDDREAVAVRALRYSGRFDDGKRRKIWTALESVDLHRDQEE